MSAEFRAGQLEIWKQRARSEHDLFLSLPLHSLQLHLQNLQELLGRLKSGRTVPRQWRQLMLTALAEVAERLARLAPRPKRLAKRRR